MQIGKNASGPEPVALDLFCGAGGLGLGLALAGFHVARHLDSWQPAVDTLNCNFATTEVATDLTSVTTSDLISMAGRTPDLIVGGPPCQGFTSAGSRRESDARNTLVGRYAALAAEIRPRAVLFENVEGFLTAGDGKFLHDLLDPLIEAGYQVGIQKLNVAHYGVPQHRKRVIALAYLGAKPDFPPPTHAAFGAPGAHRRNQHHLPPTPTVTECLAGLPAPGSSDAPQGHATSPMSDLDAARCAALSQGQTMRDLPEAMQHASYQRRANRRVMDGTPSDRRGGAPAGLRRLRADEPSKAITAAASREFVHPAADRRLTLRECARLQTFPDEFRFVGSASDQATLIGNAVPPRFAETLGRAVFAHLSGEPTALNLGGSLVELAVSNGSSMSPALERVVLAAQRRYNGHQQLTFA